MDKINKVQELQFKLMCLASFNEFDGETVVQSLREHRDLWKGAIFTRLNYSELIPLRDIDKGYWNCDTLYILTDTTHAIELKELAYTWGADEVDYMGEDVERLGGADKDTHVLRVWWD
jgi:hypothetical protein